MTIAAVTAARYAVSSLGLAAVAVSALLVGRLANPAPVVQEQRVAELPTCGDLDQRVAAGPRGISFGEIGVVGTSRYEEACQRIADYQGAFARCADLAPDLVMELDEPAPGQLTRAQAIAEARHAGLLCGSGCDGRIEIYARVVAGLVTEASALGTDPVVARCMASITAQIGFAGQDDMSLMIPVEITASSSPSRESPRRR